MDLFKITIEQFNIVMYCNPYLLIVLLCIFIFIAFYKRQYIKGDVDIDEIEMGIGNQKIKIKRNYQTIQIAYKLWVELNTRKLGMIIDEDNDVITEIYDSWYAFFGIARELIKDIPANKATNKDTKELIIFSSKILNKAIRPHLTKWQARYRDWYKRKREQNVNLDAAPQMLQKQYQCSNEKYCYATLIAEIKAVNKKLIAYKKILERIVFGEELKY